MNRALQYLAYTVVIVSMIGVGGAGIWILDAMSDVRRERVQICSAEATLPPAQAGDEGTSK